MNTKLSKAQIRELIKTKLSHNFGVSPEQATDVDFYKASVMAVKEIMSGNLSGYEQKANRQGTKRIYYLCMEFLMGRSLKNNLSNLGVEETFLNALKDFDVKLPRLYDLEPDAGLGNGGLGRLAACYLDGLATGGFPAMGYSIRYEYGIFRQKIVEGWQTELPEFWLPGGSVWMDAHPEQAVEVRFDGKVREWWDDSYHNVVHEGYTPVLAIPYDMMVSGADGTGISLLRLWKAKHSGMDMTLFNQGEFVKAIEQNAMAGAISKVLYPADDHPEGKSLRLRQQYFLVSASIQDIVKRHLAKHGTLSNLADSIAIHINDTHPALSIPELMRIMLDECGYGWDEAWDIVTKTIAYTNHTVMREALECWSEELFKARIPRIYQIITEINNRFKRFVWDASGGSVDMVARMSIIGNGTVKMANLCVAACHSVNGVSRLHSEILKETVFKDFYALMPHKFKNVTNGIAHRRWLNQANPQLAGMITELIGDGYIRDASQLQKLNDFSGDKQVLTRLKKNKLANKQRLADYIKSANGITVDPGSIFDVQVKRLHEYKRQHLNALHILSQYLYLRDNLNAPFTPRTYIFGAKAAPGYFLAKQIISFICQLSKVIEADPVVRDKLKVVYIEDYRVTLAELMMPAAEISEQISLAGTEASGTGNMKLMLNGAVTLGTMDGANVEIFEAVGDRNIIIFGMNAAEAADITAAGYNPQNYYDKNPELRRAVDALKFGVGNMQFPEIVSTLLRKDQYMVMADYEDYCGAQTKAEQLYLDQETWNRMSLANIAGAGCFAADRSIRDYAEGIWNAKPVK